MNRQEFMRRLEELLSDISPEEKEEALEFYRNYFEDAGEENEEKVIRELESPEKLAASIKAGLSMDGGDMEYTEAGVFGADRRKGDMPAKKDPFVKEEKTGDANDAASRQSYERGPQDRTLLVVLIVLVAAVTSPVWGGILLGIGGCLLGILCALFGCTVGFLVGGIVCVGFGIGQFGIGDVPGGLLVFGVGALLVSVGLLTLILCVLFCGKTLPWLVRGTVNLVQSLFRGRGKEQRI